MGMVIGISIIGVPISCLAAWFFTCRYRRRTDRTKIRKLMVWGLVAYGLLVFFATVGLDLIMFGPYAFLPSVHLVNFIPFVWIQETYQMGFARMIEQLLLNIAMFVPLGFLIPVCLPQCRKAGICLISLAGSSLFIEVLQYFIGRSADIDDLIMNVAGGMLGWLIFKALQNTKWGKEVLLKDNTDSF